MRSGRPSTSTRWGRSSTKCSPAGRRFGARRRWRPSAGHLPRSPLPPSRLNSSVPRDLETICLKCLHKDPSRRYATAAALAEDLHRFLRDEPIAARPAVGLLERTVKWVAPAPDPSALLAASLLLASWSAGACGSIVQTAHRRDAVEATSASWPGCRTVAAGRKPRGLLERAKARLGAGGRRRPAPAVGQSRRDLDLWMQLDTIRLKRVTRGELAFYKREQTGTTRRRSSAPGWERAHDQPQSVAAMITHRQCAALLAAVYDWAVCATDKVQRGWLLEVARQTDPSPDGWRQRIIDPTAWEDSEALAELARTVPVARRVGVAPAGARGTAEDNRRGRGPILEAGAEGTSGDFWANLILGNAIAPVGPPGGGRLLPGGAGRPAGDGGGLLRRRRRLETADMSWVRRSTTTKRPSGSTPTMPGPTATSACALQAQGRVGRGDRPLQKALQLDPDYAWAHHNLGNALRVKGRLDEAYEHYQQVIRLDPKNPEVQTPSEASCSARARAGGAGRLAEVAGCQSARS